MFDNRRFAERNRIDGVMSSLFDGSSNYMGIVDDVSSSGVRISHVPAGFNCSARQCFSLIRTLEEEFKAVLKPRWTVLTNKGMYKTIGFKIHNPPSGWTRFVRKAPWTTIDSEMDCA